LSIIDIASSEDFIKGESVPSLITKLILVKRLYVSDSIEAYNRQVFQGFSANHYEVKARLINLFDDLAPYLKVSLDNIVFLDLKRLVYKGNYVELLDAWDYINKFLFDKGLLNILKDEVIR